MEKINKRDTREQLEALVYIFERKLKKADKVELEDYSSVIP